MRNWPFFAGAGLGLIVFLPLALVFDGARPFILALGLATAAAIYWAGAASDRTPKRRAPSLPPCSKAKTSSASSGS